MSKITFDNKTSGEPLEASNVNEIKAVVNDNEDASVLRDAVLQQQINEIESGSSLPSQTGQTGKFLTTDGTNPSWGTPSGGGIVAIPFSNSFPFTALSTVMAATTLTADETITPNSTGAVNGANCDAVVIGDVAGAYDLLYPAFTPLAGSRAFVKGKTNLVATTYRNGTPYILITQAASDAVDDNDGGGTNFTLANDFGFFTNLDGITYTASPDGLYKKVGGAPYALMNSSSAFAVGGQQYAIELLNSPENGFGLNNCFTGFRTNPSPNSTNYDDGSWISAMQFAGYNAAPAKCDLRDRATDQLRGTINQNQKIVIVVELDGTIKYYRTTDNTTYILLFTDPVKLTTGTNYYFNVIMSTSGVDSSIQEIRTQNL